MKKKLLITGNRGFIGSNLIDYLNTDEMREKYEIADTFQLNERMGGFPDLEGIDTVIHLGAISSTIERDVRKILDFNFSFSMALLKACCEKGVDLQYSSSASVYGNTPKRKNTETDDYHPASPYAWSKTLFDYEVERQHAGLPIKVQGLRYFNVYGDNWESSKGDQASPYTKWKDAQTIKLFHGSDKIKRDFIHVDDVSNIHIKLLETDRSGIFNVGTGVPTTFEDLGQHLSKCYDKPIEYMDMPDILKPQYQYKTCSDNNKLIGAIGKYGFKNILESNPKPLATRVIPVSHPDHPDHDS
jgi:ADP-L-glycero-D-manno-heptose 6-epimerase